MDIKGRRKAAVVGIILSEAVKAACHSYLELEPLLRKEESAEHSSLATTPAAKLIDSTATVIEAKVDKFLSVKIPQ